jgi:hypothetical protein
MISQKRILTASFCLVLLMGMFSQVFGDNFETTSSEKEAIKQILESGALQRFVVKELEQKGRAIFSSGPSSQTVFLIFEENKEKGGYSANSNMTLHSMTGFGLEPRVPDISELLKGSVVRFLGNVVLGKCPLEACSFYGELDKPLSFVWIPNKGLVYLSGQGFVKLTDGTALTLPRDR